MVVGAGHNGLTLAAKLAGAGLDVLIVERNDAPGGMTTSQAFEGGFRASPHANILFYQDFAAARRRWNPEALGLKTHAPEAQAGVAFADGRPPVIVHRADRTAKTLKSVARYSRRDARRLEGLLKAALRLSTLAGEAPYVPLDDARLEQQLALSTDAFGLDRATCLGTAVGLIDSLFETPELRLLFYHLTSELGAPLTSPGGALALVSQVLPSLGRWRIPHGTMAAVAQVLAAEARRSGARVRCGTPVIGVAMEDGRCAGVVLADGAVLGARLAVVFATPVALGLDLLGDGAAPADRRRAASLAAASQGRFARATFGLKVAPDYRSSAHDPDINRCLHTLVGFDEPHDYLRHVAGLELGIPPAPAGGVRVSSHWDDTLAPRGAHVATLDVSFPPTGAFTADEWDELQAGFNEAFVDVWQAHLVNGEGLLFGAPSLNFAVDYDRRLPLWQDDSQYSAATPGVFFAGAGVMPGGGVHGGCALGAADAILSRTRLF